MAAQVKRQAKFLLYPLCYPGHFADVVRPFDKDRKFVSAQSSYQVRGTHAFFKTPGNTLQQLIADNVAKAVVYVLKSVQIDEQNADIVIVGTMGFCECRCKTVHKERPVRQACQCV